MKTYFLIFLSTFLVIFTGWGQAQRGKGKFKKGGVIQLNDSLTNYGQSDIFDFPNINKTPFYHHSEKLKKIQALEQQKRDEELYVVLRDYVKNFGMENFHKQTHLLWLLARLSEKHGPKGEAVLLYKLVLKHHRKDDEAQKIRKEFDALSSNEQDRYVPLDYYYELVAFRKEVDTLRPPHGVLVRMQDWVNSKKADYGPTIGNYDTLLLFTSKRSPHAQQADRTYNEDIYYTSKINDTWLEAEKFATINTQYNEGSACMSQDGKYLIFSRCNAPGGLGHCDLFTAELKADGKWGNVRNLGPQVNSTAWESQPSLSHTGDTLFFASDRLGGFGLSDIYFTVKDKAGKWGMAKNVGPIVNTRGNEVSPFYHHRYNALYFSSNGHPLNFGDFDIYKSYKTNRTWGEPKNIGPLVNGKGSEYYFTIDSDSHLIYYSRSTEDDLHDLDLYSFPVPMEAHPEARVKLKGSLVNSETKKPFTGIVSVIDMDHGVEVAPKFLREDGSFDFELINKRNYLLIIQGDDFFRIEEMFFLDGDMEIHKETEPLMNKIAFQSLEFENGKADILPDMHADLGRVAGFMIDHPHLKITISGHTDSQGNEKANLLLSQARADAIRNYLIEQYHIEEDRIVAKGYGSSKPLVEENTDADRKLNRRVEFDLERKD